MPLYLADALLIFDEDAGGVESTPRTPEDAHTSIASGAAITPTPSLHAPATPFSRIGEQPPVGELPAALSDRRSQK
jgi:hypothetical protein